VNYKGRTEIGLRGGGLFTEGNSYIDEDWVYGGQIAYNATQHLSIEAALLAGRTQLQLQRGNGDAMNTTRPAAAVNVLLPSCELMYNFTNGHFRPYSAAGVSDIHTQASSNARAYGYSSGKQDDFGVQYGFGAKWLFSDHFLLRADARHLIDTDYSYSKGGTSKNNEIVTLGLSWLLGHAGSQPKPEPKAEPAPVVAAVPVVVPPADADGDGVIDTQDACPGTAAGVKVDARGCPAVVDTDGDGIPDDKDECPGTPAGTAVDATGCPSTVKAIEDNWTLSGVQFESGSDKITSGSFATLDDAAETLKARSQVRVEIQGYTDNTGKPESNLALSEKRAQSVKNYLVGKGVSASQLETKGYGEASPIADNSTKEGRAKNRRIDFKVLSR
jgi:outer membrane protein OmpA-like peptidoglycan-associated protein/outer membrane protein W